MDETALSRLLHMYPVEALRERWSTQKGQTQESLIEFAKTTIVGYFFGSQSDPETFSACDLNRGVKALWGDDAIDAQHARYKPAASTRTEDMDADRLMKRDEPAEFRKAMQSPLFKTAFKTLAGDFPRLFAVDPSKGQLFFTRYPKSATEVDNVVRAILAAN